MADGLLHCRYAGREDCGLHLEGAVKRVFAPARLLALTQVFSFGVGGGSPETRWIPFFSVADAVLMRVKGKGYIPIE